MKDETQQRYQTGGNNMKFKWICEGCQRISDEICVTVEEYHLCPQCYEDYCQDIRYKYGEMKSYGCL